MDLLGGDPASLQRLLDARIVVDVRAEQDLAGAGERLDAGRDVHRLTKEIEPVVQAHDDRRAPVEADLEDDGVRDRPVERRDLLIDLERGLDRTLPGS